MSRVVFVLFSLLALLSGCASKPKDPDSSLPKGFRQTAQSRYLTPKAKVGWSYKLARESEAGKAWTHFAVVAETEATRTLEIEFSEHEGFVQALEVDKADGKVKRAVIGRDSGKTIEIKIGADSGGVTEKGEETLKVAGGEFKTRHVVADGVTKWVAVGPPVAGATVREESPTKRDLTRVGSQEPLEISGRRLDPRVLTYSDESRVWWSSDEMIQALNGGRVRTQEGTSKTSIQSLGTEAKPRVTWPKAKEKEKAR
ncbi:MAG: hypothetical protein JKY65_17370 [Planctomycetes bacterium]|nr:hypothetical protein [Planctomycetota bacterium]